MPQPRLLRIYLDDGLRQSAVAGRHNFIGKIEAVARGAGYRVEYRPDSPSERLKAPTRRGYALFHMEGPQYARAMIFRRVYHYPFWAIERSAKRWEWRVAQSEFPEGDVPRQEADRFYRFWRRRLFGEAPERAVRDGFVYVPLQGKLLTQRSFQTCAPTEMVRAVCAHDPDRQVVAALHPKEVYSDAELSALEALTKEFPQLRLCTGQMQDLLAGCDHVVTQNSGAAFAGYFFGKPAVLFGQIDFHHIAAKVSATGVTDALEAGPQLAPDYAGYLHWFWQIMSINAGRDTAEDNIRAAFIRAGWPI